MGPQRRNVEPRLARIAAFGPPHLDEMSDTPRILAALVPATHAART